MESDFIGIKKKAKNNINNYQEDSMLEECFSPIDFIAKFVCQYSFQCCFHLVRILGN